MAWPRPSSRLAQGRVAALPLGALPFGTTTQIAAFQALLPLLYFLLRGPLGFGGAAA